MPFVIKMNSRTNQPEGYHWIIHPYVMEDMSIIDPNVSVLTIESASTIPTPIPLLDFFNTGHLRKLEIEDMDITDMPRIPSSVSILKLKNTSVKNLNEINVDWSQIRLLELHNNIGLNGSSLIVPEGIRDVFINGNIFDIIRLPSTINIFQTYDIYMNLVTGYMPKNNILFGYKSHYPKYWMAYRMIKEQQDVELEPEWGQPEIQRIKEKWCKKFVENIKYINTAYNYQMYEEIGSIKSRIKNPMENRENPIVAALFLGSNYLRRSAEFMTEETII